MISFDEITRYVLIFKEEQMENNYKLNSEQIELSKRINEMMLNNPILKQKINLMINSKSISEMSKIWYSNISIFEPSTEFEPSIESNSTSGGEGKQYVKTAGFVDAMIMALITGFVSGMAISILFLMLS